MLDFTLKTYDFLIGSLADMGYSFQTFEEFMKIAGQGSVVLRHDVDRKPGRAIRMAELENSRGVRASYHFRVLQKDSAANEAAIKRVTGLGHEIAYHYEDYSRVMRKEKGVKEKAYSAGNHNDIIMKAEESFRHNLQYLRQFYPVRVISMHGDPLSDYDNRDLWKFLDYSDYDVICEPYLDVDYDKVSYLTDTGRRWDAGRSNRRDRIPVQAGEMSKRPEYKPRTTFQVVRGISSGYFGKSIVLSTHPQRWSVNYPEWMAELINQNIKNIAKSLLKP